MAGRGGGVAAGRDGWGDAGDAASDWWAGAGGEPAVLQRRRGRAGGVAADQPPPKGAAAVEARRGAGSIAGVFEEDDGAVGAQDAGGLADGAGLIAGPTQRERRHDGGERRDVEP